MEALNDSSPGASFVRGYVPMVDGGFFASGANQ
jgi:hypothetical protein